MNLVNSSFLQPRFTDYFRVKIFSTGSFSQTHSVVLMVMIVLQKKKPQYTFTLKELTKIALAYSLGRFMPSC
jgi:hypothetical protein